MSDTITCPKCQTPIEITEVMSAQLTSQIRSELEAELMPQRQELNKQAAELAKQQKSVDEQIAKGVADQREQLVAEARKKAAEDVAVELKDSEAQLKALHTKLKKAQDNELALRSRERELKERQEELELTVTRKLDKERDKIRKVALKQAADDHQLKAAEKDKKISDLVKQLDEMKRKAEQGSQQAQGEIQELALEDLLRHKFPEDIIEDVPKGIRGGDVIQRVMSPSGVDCGTILWESKRTKNWSRQWLPKLRQDQREAKAAIPILVSTVLPDGVDHFAQVDGVWVSSWQYAGGLASALRVVLLEAAKVKRANEGQQDKMAMVYNYLSSHQFRNRLTGIVEAFKTMQMDLDGEKRAIQKQWAKREKQIEQAVGGTVGMYGDFQGIIGATLPEIEGMTLPQLEAET